MNSEKLELLFNENEPVFVEDWKHFLTFASISADAQFEGDCRACAEWLSAHLTGIGFQSELLEIEGAKPVVYAERKGDANRPVVLIYGHYDVQPVDPEEAWDTPPFEPTLREGRIYARGAQDNKGQVLYTLKALEVLLKHQVALPTIKIIIEGEEEHGSGGLSRSLEAWKVRLQADVLMVHDTGTVRSGAPTITMGLRGMAHLLFELDGANHDLHSGMHGGLAPNPAQGIAQMVAGLFNVDGSVVVAGFYDEVRPPNELEKKLAAESPFDAEEYERLVGAIPVGGQKGISPVERVGFQPSLDINGIHSGYGGEGMKTVLPAKAIAKISMRLVPDQEPDKVSQAVQAHLEQHVPDGMRLRVTDAVVGGPGFRLNPESELVDKAASALEQVGDLPVAYLWEGASIPIVSALSEASGATPLLVGFGHEDDHIHAPNESFSLKQFKDGFKYVALILQKI